MFENFDLYRVVMNLLVFIPAVTIHEYCHAKFADLAGDLTPRTQGRVTLNPLSHLDPMGTIMVVISSIAGVGIGWGKPVMVNVGKMKNPRWDHFVSVVMGPVSNFVLAILCAIVLKSGMLSSSLLSQIGIDSLTSIRSIWTLDYKAAFSSVPGFVAAFVYLSLIKNLGLFFFNLIPMGPLDGHWLVGAMLQPIQRNKWLQFCHGPGMMIFLVLIFVRTPAFDPIGQYMSSTINFAFRLLLGGG